MGFFCLYGVGGLILLIFVLTFTPCLGGGIGRHAGLKILWTVMSVPVRPRPEVPKWTRSSAGRAQPCQGWGRGFESRLSLNDPPRWRVFFKVAPVVELVDTPDLKSCGQ